MSSYSSSEECFTKALGYENAGDSKKAEMWLRLAVKREDEEKDNVLVPLAAEA